MDNQEFSDADLGLTPPVKPENNNTIIPDMVAPAVKRRDWNSVTDDDLFAPAKPSMFKPESLFKDISPVITSDLGHGEAVILTTDAKSQRLGYWDKNEQSFRTKKPIMKYLKPGDKPGEIGELPDAVSSTKMQMAQKEHEALVKKLDEKKKELATFEADLAKTPGGERYIGNYTVDLRESIKELEEQVRATKNEKFDPEGVLAIQRGQGALVTFGQNLARSGAHTLGTLPGFTAAAPTGFRLGMKVPGPPVVKAVSGAIGGAITGTLGGMVSGGIEQALENWIIPVSEQEKVNTMTSPTAATVGQTASLAIPFNLQKVSTLGKAVGIGAKTSGMRNAARLEILKNSAGMVPIGMSGRGAESIKTQLSEKRDAEGNRIEDTGFSVKQVAKDIFDPKSIGHDLLTGAFIRGANKVGRTAEFHKAGAWIAGKVVPAGKISPEQKALFDEAVRLQQEHEARAKAAEQADAAGQQGAPQAQQQGGQAQQTQQQNTTTRPAGSVEPLPAFPPDNATDAERNAWLTAAQEWHEKYAATHEFDGTPKPVVQPQAQAQTQAQPQTQVPPSTPQAGEASGSTIASRYRAMLKNVLEGKTGSGIFGKRFEGVDKRGKTYEQRVMETIRKLQEGDLSFLGIESPESFATLLRENPGVLEALIVTPTGRLTLLDNAEVRDLHDQSQLDPDIIDLMPDHNARRIKAGMKWAPNVNNTWSWVSPNPKHPNETAKDPSIFEMQVPRPETAPAEPAPRKLTPQEQEAADLADFDPNSVNPEIPKAPKRTDWRGDESMPGFKPEFLDPNSKGAAEGVEPIVPRPELPPGFLEGIPKENLGGGWAVLIDAASKDPNVPENVRNLIRQKIDADKINFDLISQEQSKWSKNKDASEAAIRSQPGKENISFDQNGLPRDSSASIFRQSNSELIKQRQAEWDAQYGADYHDSGEMKYEKTSAIRKAAVEEARKKHLESKALAREVEAERAKNEAEAKKQAELKAKKEAEKQAQEQAAAKKNEPKAPSKDQDMEERLSPEDNAWIASAGPKGMKNLAGTASDAIREFIRRPFTDKNYMSLAETKAMLEEMKDKKGQEASDIRKINELRIKYHSAQAQGAKPKKPVKPEPVEPENHFLKMDMHNLRMQKKLNDQMLNSEVGPEERAELERDRKWIQEAMEAKGGKKNESIEDDVETKETDAKLVARRDSLIEDAREFREQGDDASFKEFMEKAAKINDRIKDPKKKIVLETDRDLNEKEDTIATENEVETPEPSKDEDIRTEAIDLARQAIKDWEAQKAKLEKLNDRKPSEKTEKQIRALENKIESNRAAIDSMVEKERARREKLDPLKDKADILEQNKAKAQAKQDLERLRKLEESGPFKSTKINSIKNYSAVLGKSISDLYDATKKSMDKETKDVLEGILKIVNLIHDFNNYEDLTNVEGPAKKSILKASQIYADILAGKDKDGWYKNGRAMDIRADLNAYFKNLKTLYSNPGEGDKKAVKDAIKFFGKETPVEQEAAEAPKTEPQQEEVAPSDIDVKRYEEDKKRREAFKAMSHGDWEMFRSRSIQRIKELTKLLNQLYGRKNQTKDVLDKISKAHAEVHSIANDIVKTGVFDPDLKLPNGKRESRDESIREDLFDAILAYEFVPPEKGHEVGLNKLIEANNKMFAKREAELGSTAKPDKEESDKEKRDKRTRDEAASAGEPIPEEATQEPDAITNEKFKAMEKLFKQRLDAFEIASEYRKKDSPIREFIDLVDQLWTENKQYSLPESLAGYKLYNLLSHKRLVSPEFFKNALEAFKGVRLRMHIKGAADFKRVIENAMSRSEIDAKLPELIKKYQDLRDNALRDLEKARKDKNKAKINDANDRLVSAQASLSRILDTAASRGIDTTKLIQGEGVARTDAEAPGTVEPKNVKPKKTEAAQTAESKEPADKIIKTIVALEAFTNEAQNYSVVPRRETKGTDGKWYTNGNFPAGVKQAFGFSPRTNGWILRHNVSMTTHGPVHAVKEQAQAFLDNYQKKQSADFEKALREMGEEKLLSQLKFWMKEGEKYGNKNNKQKEFADLVESLGAELDKEAEAPKAPEAPKEPVKKTEPSPEEVAKKKAEDEAIAAAKGDKDFRVDQNDGITYANDGLGGEVPVSVTVENGLYKSVKSVVKAGVDLDGTEPYQEIMPKGGKYFTNGRLIYIESESALDRTPPRKNQQRKIEDVDKANSMGDGVMKIDGKRWIDVTLPSDPQTLTFEVLERVSGAGESRRGTQGVIRISTAWSTARRGMNAQAFYSPDILRQLMKNMDKYTTLKLVYADQGKETIVIAVAVKHGKIVGLAMPLNPKIASMGTLYNPKASRARSERDAEPESEAMASEEAMRAAQQGREMPKSAQGDLFAVEGENYNRRVKPGVMIGEDGLPIRPGAGRRGQGELSHAQISGKEYTEGGFPQWFDIGHNETEYTVGKKYRNVEPESVIDVYGTPPDTGFEPGDVFSPREDMFAFGVDGSFRKTQADKYTPDHEEWLSPDGNNESNWVPKEYSWYGRVNHPVYDTNGNVVIRGAISVVLNPETVVKSNASSEAGVEMQTKDGRVKIRGKMPAETAQRIKEMVAGEMPENPDSTDSPSRVLHLDRPENYDVFVFDESVSARRERGISSEDAAPSQLMPAGTYNPGPNHMKPNHSDAELAKRGFISHFADKNIPDNLRDRLTLDISEVGPGWVYRRNKKPDDPSTYEGVLRVDLGNGHTREIGQFTYRTDQEHGSLEWIKVNYAFRGRKLSEVIGAELLERMRRDQVESVDAMVVDPLERPIRMLERLLGMKNKTMESTNIEESDALDQFGTPDPDNPGKFYRKVTDVQFDIPPDTELTTSGHKNKTGRAELDKFFDTGSTPETEQSTMLRVEASLDKPMDIANAADMVLKDLPETPRGLLLRQLSRVAKSKGLQISFRSTGSKNSWAMAGKEALGAYTGHGETIRIWMPDVQKEVDANGYKMLDTLIYVMSHEIAHHHTLQLINDNAKITGFGENSIGFKDRVKALMDYAVVHNLSDLSVVRPGGRLEYGLTKEAEFMAEVLTNPRFRDMLNKIPALPDKNVRTGKQSVLDQILFAVKLAFRKIGINIDKETLLDRGTELYAEALATPNRTMDKREQEVAREGAFGPGFDKTYKWDPRSEAPQTLEQSNAEVDANKDNLDKLNSNNPSDVEKGIDGIVGDSELMPPSGGGGGAPASSPGSAPRSGKTRRQKVFDFVTLRALSGISVKAHQNSRRYPNSAALRAVANFIHARPGTKSRAFQRDIPTSIYLARQKFQNQFVDIMTPIRSMLDSFKDAPNNGPTAAEQRELVYRTIHDMVTGTIPMAPGKIGEVATKIKGLMKTLHEYRTLAGEKIGEIEDYFPAKYDSDRIAQNEQAFVADATRAYELTISGIDSGPFYDNPKLKKKAAEFKAEAQAEKAKALGIDVAQMLAMPKAKLDGLIKAKARGLADVLFRTHQRGMSQEEFSSIFGGDSIMSGSESASLRRVFRDQAQRVMQKWQHADPFRVVSSYIASATKRAELVRKFGDDGKVWENYSSKMERDGVPRQVIREMRRLMRLAAGVGTPPRGEGAQTYVDGLGLATAAAALGKSAMNNLVEPVTMGGRSNSLRRMAEGYLKTWVHSARNILRISDTLDKRLGPTFWEEFGHHIGTIHKSIDDAWTMGHTTDVEVDNTGSTLRWLTNRVYKANLMDATETAKQTASLSIGRNYIRDLALLTKKQHWMNKVGMDPAQSTADNLSELGIQPGLQKKFADWVMTLDGLSKQQLMDKITKGDQMSRLFEEAMVRFAKQSSVVSNRAHKPEFQDSSGGATVLNLMNYSYSFAAEVNSRVYDHIKQSVTAAPKGKSYGASDRMMMLMAPVISGSMSVAAYYALFELKQKLYPTDMSSAMLGQNVWAKLLNAFSYAGFSGPKFEYAMKFVQRDQMPGGPTVKMAANVGRAAASAASIPFSDKSPGAAQKSLVKAAIPLVKGGIVTGASAANPIAGAAAVQLTNMTQPQNELLESLEDKKKKGIGDLLEAKQPGSRPGNKPGSMEAKEPGKKK